MSILSTIFNKIASIGQPNYGQGDQNAAGDSSGSSLFSSANAAETAGKALDLTGVNVEQALGKLATEKNSKLDWKHSIVDLMKLLGMDSSLNARTELAKELGYEGDTSDSASMNMWLQKQVMQRLKDNNGKIGK